MKSGHKALGVLLLLCGVLFNPFILAWLFSNDGNISSSSLLFSVLAVELLIVFFGVTVFRFEREWLSKMAVAFLSVVFTVVFSLGADRFYGAFIMPETADLLFPSFSKAEHKTSEFDLRVRINNLGFRGPNAVIEKTKKRVLIIGDSFTFGWGVELEETWIQLLSKDYPEIEFLNLGQGGNHPGDYVQVAKRTIPLLKPDAVWVCLLEGNDLSQLMRVVEYEQQPKIEEQIIMLSEPRSEKLKRYLSILFPNFSVRFQATNSIQERWIQDSRNVLFALSKEQEVKYQSLNDDIRNAFEKGRLNPSLIYESLHHPHLFREAVDTSNALCKMGITRLHDHLLELKELAITNESELLFITMPNRPYGFPKELSALSELGFEVSGCDTLDGRLPLLMAASDLEVAVLGPQLAQNEEGLFYHYDGHWNATGNRIFAEELSRQLYSLKRWKHFLTSSNF